MSFMTEKEMERLLSLETRLLDVPESGSHPFCMMRVYWSSLDFVVPRYSSLDLLLRHAQDAARIHGIDLDTALALKATALHRWAKDALGVPMQTMPGLCPLAWRGAYAINSSE